jgi:hypothetical protein
VKKNAPKVQYRKMKMVEINQELEAIMGMLWKGHCRERNRIESTGGGGQARGGFKLCTS